MPSARVSQLPYFNPHALSISRSLHPLSRRARASAVGAAFPSALTCPLSARWSTDARAVAETRAPPHVHTTASVSRKGCSAAQTTALSGRAAFLRAAAPVRPPARPQVARADSGDADAACHVPPAPRWPPAPCAAIRQRSARQRIAAHASHARRCSRRAGVPGADGTASIRGVTVRPLQAYCTPCT